MNYTTEDLNKIYECRTYLSNMYKYIILSSDRKTKKTDFLIEYAIKTCMKNSNSKILFLVEYEKDKMFIIKKISNIVSNSRLSSYNDRNFNKIILTNKSSIIIDNQIPKGHHFDIILIDDADNIFNNDKIRDEFNIMYKYITNKVIMCVVKDYNNLINIPDEFNLFTVDKNTSISTFRKIKIDKIRKNMKLLI